MMDYQTVSDNTKRMSDVRYRFMWTVHGSQ